jgi:hypothetical protein
MSNVQSIEKLIKESLNEIPKIGTEEKLGSKFRLIFPLKRGKKIRHSEQEAKFLFIRNVENQSEFHYSVETPTKKAYKDFTKGEPKQEEDGRSGAIDVTLHNKDGARIALIEFKYGANLIRSIRKDFLKLLIDAPEIELNYFIHVVPNTSKDLYKEYKELLDYIKKGLSKKGKIPTSEIKIFLFAIGEGIKEYKIDKSLTLTEV